MKTLSYNIRIYATPERVWDILWGNETYNVWTKFFSCDSQMKSDWKVGGKTYFTDGDGNGMVSTIERIDAVSYTHLRGPRDRTRSRMPSSA